MASSSGTSLGSEGDLLSLMDQRKRKRMISNRESARRSRMRKQNHMDGLIGEIAQLRKENHQILTNLNVTTQHLMNVEAENSVLRAQVSELSNRLISLNEIVSLLNLNYGGGGGGGGGDVGDFNNFMNPLNFMYLNQPIMANSADIFQY